MSAPYGLLWFDDFPGTPIEQKVRDAVARYREKYGEQPAVVHINHKQGQDMTIDGVPVKAERNILVNHVWVQRSEAA